MHGQQNIKDMSMLPSYMTTTLLAGCMRQADSRVCKQSRTYCPETVESAPQMEVRQRGKQTRWEGERFLDLQ